MGKSYVCPHCGAYAGMEESSYEVQFINDSYYWLNGAYKQAARFVNENGKPIDKNGNLIKNDILTIVTCRACNQYQLWINDHMVYPMTTNIPLPSKDMPNNIKNLYNEARNVFEISPKSGAALLRLALQMLCKELGEDGKKINDNIAKLVKKGLPVEIQQALDTIRVVGNNSVHPGELNLDEDKDLAASLFPLLNLIVDRMIGEPKRIQELYQKLPSNILEAISKRDKQRV